MTIAKLDRPANGAWRHDDPRTARTLPSRYFNVGEHLVLHFHGLVYDAIHA